MREAIGRVVAVCRRAEPGLPKEEVPAVQVLADYGVVGDYHAGPLVRHRYLVRKDPLRPNVRQVLLSDTHILAALAEQGMALRPGMLGENVVLDGVAVMTLPGGTRLLVGEVLLEITEARAPCSQLDAMHPRLQAAVTLAADAQPRWMAGMFARVVRSGWIRPGDAVFWGEEG